MSSVYVVCWIFLQTSQSYFLRTGKKEQSDLGPHCLQKWLLKSQAEDKADDNCCDWRFTPPHPRQIHGIMDQYGDC